MKPNSLYDDINILLISNIILYVCIIIKYIKLNEKKSVRWYETWTKGVCNLIIYSVWMNSFSDIYATN